ncbi:hypothetical protein [Limnohabitans sp.]|uniref:hypothetical protein n=1 Tax=Limnohabitans sp. TaxID=1907725 RepID=UPI003340FA0B
MHLLKYLVCALALIGFTVSAKPIGQYPVMQVSELPDPLRSQWKIVKPEMTKMSHCAAAFDSHTDGEKMAWHCSIYIKMSAEGERRAMHSCEEKRVAKGIKMPCKLIEE